MQNTELAFTNWLVHSTYLYGDLAQGEGMFKANKTTLTNVAEVAGTGTLDSEEIFQYSAWMLQT